MKTEWVHKKLGDDLFDFIKGEQINGELLLFSGQYPMYNGGIEPSGYLDTYNTTAPQIIMSEGGNSCGFINYITDDFWRGGHCYLVKLKKEDLSDKKFFYYLLKYHEENIMKLRVGSGLPNIQKNDLYKYPISYPADLSAQRRIATILSSADKVITSTQKIIAKYKQIKQGLMEDLLKPKEGWKMVRLGECCEIITGPFGSSLHEKDYTKEGTPVINPQNIVNNKIIAIDSCLVNDETVERLSKYKMKSGDIVIARRGEMGRCAVVEANQEGWLCGTGSFAIKVHPEKIDAYFLQLQLSSNSTKIVLENNSIGATMSNLNQSILSELEIDTPSLAEQRRIAAILSGIDAKIAAEEKVLEKYEKVKKGLMERMLDENDN